MLNLEDENELQEIADEIDSIFRCHRTVLNSQPRIANGLKDSLEAARTKVRDSQESRRPPKNR